MINWKIRIKNKNFWITLVPSILLLIQAVASVFNYTIQLGALGDKLLIVVNSIFAVLTILGVINDPTTEGIADSKLAMTYNTPKAKEKA